MVHIYNSINRNISLCEDNNFQLPFPVVDHSIGYISDYFDKLIDSSFISKSKLQTEKKRFEMSGERAYCSNSDKGKFKKSSWI